MAPSDWAGLSPAVLRETIECYRIVAKRLEKELAAERLMNSRLLRELRECQE